MSNYLLRLPSETGEQKHDSYVSPSLVLYRFMVFTLSRAVADGLATVLPQTTTLPRYAFTRVYGRDGAWSTAFDS